MVFGQSSKPHVGDVGPNGSGPEEPLCRRALRNRERHLGREHRDTLTSVPGGGWEFVFRFFCIVGF